jgi:hypothetical protein
MFILLYYGIYRVLLTRTLRTQVTLTVRIGGSFSTGERSAHVACDEVRCREYKVVGLAYVERVMLGQNWIREGVREITLVFIASEISYVNCICKSWHKIDRHYTAA